MFSKNTQEYVDYINCKYKLKDRKDGIFVPYYLKIVTFLSIHKLLESQIGQALKFCHVHFDENYGFISADYYEIKTTERCFQEWKDTVKFRCEPFGITPSKYTRQYDFIYVDPYKGSVWQGAYNLAIPGSEPGFMFEIESKDEINDIIDACENSRIDLENNKYDSNSVQRNFKNTLPIFEKYFFEKKDKGTNKPEVYKLYKQKPDNKKPVFAFEVIPTDD